VGDKVLVNVAILLKSSVREVDTVARLGGDEFVVLIDMIDDSRHVTIIVRKLHNLFQHAIQTDGREIHVYASIGVGMFPGDGKDADELIHKADLAMYNSKRDGGNTSSYPVFGSEEAS
jgi:diguanylate cyclase (GGDEF)-like protein